MVRPARRNDACPAPTPVVGGFADDGPRDSRRPYGIADWLLWQNTAGACVVRFAGGEVLTTAGDVVLIAPRTAHDYGTPAGARRWGVRWVVFAALPTWADLLRWPTPVAPGIATFKPSAAAGKRIAGAIDTAWQVAAGVVTGREALALNAVEAALLWCQSDLRVAPHGDARARLVADTVSEHLARPIGLAGAARLAQLSPAQFARCFRATYGTSFATWVEGRRMARAQELLRHSDQPIAAIAQAIGYLDPFHFSACFRRRCGMSPRGFRQTAVDRDGA